MSLRRSPIAALSLSYAGMFAPAIAVTLLPVLLSALSVTYGGAGGLSKEQLGRISAAIFTGLVAGIATAAPLAERLGPRVLAVGGNLLTAAGLAAVAAAPRFELMLLGAAVMGLGAGLLDLVLSPLVAV